MKFHFNMHPSDPRIFNNAPNCENVVYQYTVVITMSYVLYVLYIPCKYIELNKDFVT